MSLTPLVYKCIGVQILYLYEQKAKDPQGTVFSQSNRKVWCLFIHWFEERERRGLIYKDYRGPRTLFLWVSFFVKKVSFLPEIKNGVNAHSVCVSACSRLTPPHSLDLGQHLGGLVRMLFKSSAFFQKPKGFNKFWF